MDDDDVPSVYLHQTLCGVDHRCYYEVLKPNIKFDKKDLFDG